MALELTVTLSRCAVLKPSVTLVFRPRNRGGTRLRFRQRGPTGRAPVEANAGKTFRNIGLAADDHPYSFASSIMGISVHPANDLAIMPAMFAQFESVGLVADLLPTLQHSRIHRLYSFRQSFPGL